jgi:hypothetical protein
LALDFFPSFFVKKKRRRTNKVKSTKKTHRTIVKNAIHALSTTPNKKYTPTNKKKETIPLLSRL